MHTGIKGQQVHPPIRFSTEEPRMSPRQPAMVQDCGMGTYRLRSLHQEMRDMYVTETFPICRSLRVML